jgi:16S rRNA (cytosine967-C5)-methyltransferase
MENATVNYILKELKHLKDQNIKAFLNQLSTFSWKRALEEKSSIQRLSIMEAMPSFFIERLLPVMSMEFLKENIQYLNDLTKYEKFSIRFNDLFEELPRGILFEKILTSFKKEGLGLLQDREISEIFHAPITQKNKIIQNEWYKKGYIIVQDKASAIVVKILDPKPNELICDMCAAPGVKTSMIAQFSNNRARIIAGEYLPQRAFQCKKFLSSLNVKNQALITTDSIEFPVRFEEQFDRVLLDAPCTGSGTFLANPELKWRQSDKFLHQNVVLQKKLLNTAIKMLKPNGVLVYSTCSLYPEEGEYQVRERLNSIKPLDISQWTSPSYNIDGSPLPGTGRLFPSIHHTQGFFIGKFKKKEK